MSKEVDHNNVALFQDGKLKAFGTMVEYEEANGEFITSVRIDKGSLNCGEHQMQITREYDVLTDTNGIYVQ